MTTVLVVGAIWTAVASPVALGLGRMFRLAGPHDRAPQPHLHVVRDRSAALTP